MGIEVVKTETDFSRYDLSPIDDHEQLSWKASALLFVIVNVDGEVSVDTLIEMSSDGDHSVKCGLQELQQNNLISVRSKNTGRKLEYFVSSGSSEHKKFDTIKRHELSKNKDQKYEKLSKRNGEYCKFCGAENDLEIDHKLPVSKGGRNDIENLQLLCETCNRDKGDMEMEEWLQSKRRV